MKNIFLRMPTVLLVCFTTITWGSDNAAPLILEALYPIIESPYFKASCIAVAAGTVVYYWTHWTNTYKKDRRKLPAKELAIGFAVGAGIGSFHYFNSHQ